MAKLNQWRDEDGGALSPSRETAMELHSFAISFTRESECLDCTRKKRANEEKERDTELLTPFRRNVGDFGVGPQKHEESR